MFKKDPAFARVWSTGVFTIHGIALNDTLKVMCKIEPGKTAEQLLKARSEKYFKMGLAAHLEICMGLPLENLVALIKPLLKKQNR